MACPSVLRIAFTPLMTPRPGGPRGAARPTGGLPGGLATATLVVVAAGVLVTGCGGPAAYLPQPDLPRFDRVPMPRDVVSAHAQLQRTVQQLDALSSAAQRHRVSLPDLGQDMARFANDPDTDFLSAAVDQAGERIEFAYYEIGSPRYDRFVRDVMTLRALTYQVARTLEQMATVSGELLGQPVVVSGALRVQVATALLQRDPTQGKARKLARLRDLAKSCAYQSRRLASRVRALRREAAGLTRGQDALFLAVKLGTDRDVLQANLSATIDVVPELLQWADQMLPQILAFGRQQGGQHPVLDVQGGRMDRAELAQHMFSAEDPWDTAPEGDKP